MESFYIAHFSALIAVAILTVAMLHRARRWRYSIHGEILDRALILLTGAIWLVTVGARGSAVSLPLIIIGLCAPLAVATRRRAFRAILYYWGIGLCARAAISPIVNIFPLHLDFWLYWFAYAGIFAAGAYDLVVNRYRPTWRDCAFACVATTACIGSILPIDAQRILQTSVLNVAVFLTMTIPWALLRLRPRVRTERVMPVLEEDSELVYST